MKKILLLAVAALMTASASANALSHQKQGKAQSFRVQPTLQQTKLTQAPAAFTANPGRLQVVNREVGKKLSNSMFNLKAMKSISTTRAAQAPRKAGAVQTLYKGHGIDFESSESVDWEMTKGTTSEGDDALFNVIPNVFGDTISVGAYYIAEDGQITIPAQQVLSYVDSANVNHYIFLCSSTNAEGDIVLTLGDNGSLKTVSGESILYGDFTDEFFDPEFGDTYDGYWEIVDNVKYLMPGEIPTPVAEYEPEGLFLHMGISASGYGYTNNLAMMPAYAPVPFKTYCEDIVDNWSWSMNVLKVNETGDDYEIGEVLTANTQDFAPVTENGVYNTPVLQASYQTASSDPFQWGLMLLDDEGNPNYEEGYVYAGASGSDYVFTDDTYSTITKCNPDFSIAYYSFLGTPDVNSSGYSLSSLILYQGKPSAPLYIEGVNYLVRSLTMTDKFELKCKLVKCTRTPNGRLTLGDVIAEADIDKADVIEGGDGSIYQLNWTSFYVEDEESGLSEDLDHIFIEDEFAVVIEGWDNGTFSCSPYGEYDYNTQGMTSTYIYETGDENLYRFPSLYSHQYVGFNGATYGYLKTDEEPVFNIPNEGGQASIHVNPMLCSIDAETEENTTRLFLEGEEEEMPDWFTVGIANEVYNQETGEWGFDLVVEAEALPEGTENRSGEVTVWQEGALLTITVLQGEGAGVEGVKATVKGNGKIYTLSGLQNKNAKGIMIRDGKKFLKK